jgi:hypothetical protein
MKTLRINILRVFYKKSEETVEGQSFPYVLFIPSG